jgi:hypothetical protein
VTKGGDAGRAGPPGGPRLAPPPGPALRARVRAPAAPAPDAGRPPRRPNARAQGALPIAPKATHQSRRNRSPRARHQPRPLDPPSINRVIPRGSGEGGGASTRSRSSPAFRSNRGAAAPAPFPPSSTRGNARCHRGRWNCAPIRATLRQAVEPPRTAGGRTVSEAGEACPNTPFARRDRVREAAALGAARGCANQSLSPATLRTGRAAGAVRPPPRPGVPRGQPLGRAVRGGAAPGRRPPDPGDAGRAGRPGRVCEGTPRAGHAGPARARGTSSGKRGRKSSDHGERGRARRRRTGEQTP